MTYTIKLRRGDSSDWTAVNPVLSEGEPGVELDTNFVKIGDGSTPWNSLEYTIGPGTGLPSAIGLPDNQMLVTLDEAWVIIDASAVLEGGGASTIITEITATEGQDEFTIPSVPLPGTLRVTRGGLLQTSAHWDLVDTTVTLLDPCVAGENIVIEQDGPAEVVYGIGPEGPQGPQGEQGLTGSTGATGPPGDPGVDATRGPVTINDQTGTTYSLLLSDATKWIRLNNASAITLTIPASTDINFPIGTLIEGNQAGAGQFTIAGAVGVTVNGDPGLKVAAQYGVFGLLKVGTDTWLAYGRLSA